MDPMFFFYLTGGALLFLVVSMLLGHGHHGAHGHHVGHGTGHGHGAGHGHGGGGGHGTVHVATAGHGAASAHGAAQGQTGVRSGGTGNLNILSFQIVFLFVAGFGVGGYFPALVGFGTFVTLLFGVAGGVALAAIGYFVINIFYSRQSDSNINSEEYVGLTGIIVTSINGNSVGRVRCEIGTSRDTFLAKSADGSSVPVNSVVRITAMVGSTAVVEITDPTQIPGDTWRQLQ